MHLFTATEYTGEINYNCDEGELCWVDKDKIYQLNLWEGDKIFLDLLNKEQRFFKVELNYIGDRLISHTINY
jgi:8-oxo-dGTP diphosphatase